MHPKVQEKMLELLKRWAEGEFSKDAKYSLIPSFYNNLKVSGCARLIFKDKLHKYVGMIA